jgi:hypothetical protein
MVFFQTDQIISRLFISRLKKKKNMGQLTPDTGQLIKLTGSLGPCICNGKNR